MRLSNRLVCLLLELVNFGVQKLLLGLSLLLELSQLDHILVFQVQLVKLSVSDAQFLNGFENLLLDWVVLQVDLCDGLVGLEGILDLLTRLVSNQIVPHVQSLQRGEFALEHFQEV
jgi:hypothetical protein